MNIIESCVLKRGSRDEIRSHRCRGARLQTIDGTSARETARRYYGAHRLDDAGAISGCGLAEVVLNELDAVNVLSLRAGYFYSNLLLSLDLVKTAGHKTSPKPGLPPIAKEMAVNAPSGVGHAHR
jgi:hypothetical protein